MEMVVKKILSGVILLVVVLAGIYIFNSFAEHPLQTAGVINNPSEGNNVIEMSNSGFSPSTLTIAKGETVTFVSVDSGLHWPASDIHPTHTIYPGSSIQKCGTAEQENIFDSCGGLKEGESWSFTFKDVGNWNFHDHLHPQFTGTIIVKG